MARGHRKRLFLQRRLWLVREVWLPKGQTICVTGLCLQLKTGFLPLKVVMWMSLLKAILRDLYPERLAGRGAWCLVPSVQLELAPLSWCWPLQGDALIYPGYKIASKHRSCGIKSYSHIVAAFDWDYFQLNVCCKAFPALFYLRSTLKGMIFKLSVCLVCKQCQMVPRILTLQANNPSLSAALIFLYNQCT